jgi:hypothetical protein
MNEFVKDYTYMHPGFNKEKLKNFELIDESKLIIDKNVDEDFKGLKNFLRYRVIGKLNVCKISNFDYDKLDEVSLDLRKYINMELGQKIDFSQYVTDTANSVQTLLGIYMRGKYKNCYQNYQCPKNVPYKIKEGYRDYNLLNLLDSKIFDDDIILRKIDKLCSLYHTLGNMIYVPSGFNNGRVKLNGKNTNDFIDIGLNYLKENKYKWNNHYYFNNNDKIFEIMTGYNYFKDMSSNFFSQYNTNSADDKLIIVLDKMIESINKRNNRINEVLKDQK